MVRSYFEAAVLALPAIVCLVLALQIHGCNLWLQWCILTNASVLA